MNTPLQTPRDGKYVVLRLADQTYGIPIESVAEILPMAELSQVPGAPSFLTGFLNLEGSLVGIVSLRILFGLGEEPATLYTPLVVLKSATPRIALLVDAVSEIVSIREEDVLPTAQGYSFNQCATASARLGKSNILLLSPQQILLAQEAKRVTELAALEAERLESLASVTV